MSMPTTRIIVLLISTVLATGCRESGEGKGPTPRANQSKSPNRTPPLASLTDRDAFARQFALIKNPHILTAARYLSNQSNGVKPNAARPPGVNPGVNNDYQIEAYPLMEAVWPDPNVQTCWENPQTEFETQMLRVQQSIAETWQSASKLRFTGWASCPATWPSTQQIIRIQIADASPNNGPRTLGLGKQLAGVSHGMLLNFTFLHWGTNCQTMVDYCVKAIAVHEFGHAIGLAHEQNRPDKPGECMDAPQGTNGDNTELTPYDPQSVMNYCNSKYNNGGNLSALDKEAVSKLYGAP